MMKKTIAILLAMLLILTAVPFTGAFAAEDKGAPSEFAANAALYVHAVSDSADTQAWQEWQSVHDEDFVVDKPNEKYFFLPSSTAENVIDVYNGFDQAVIVNGVSIAAQTTEAVPYTVNSTYTVTAAGSSYTLKIMRSKAEGAIYVNNPDADGSGTDLMTFLNDDKSNSAAATGGAAQDYGLGQTCADGNILHCFNWTLSQIKAELPNIAQAGFTSVQTSPLQPHDGRNQWYWLYQPTNFTVGNELGSYSDLQSLCAEAHRYGIKIIVDVVANHVAGSDSGNWANSVDSSLKKSQYFHNLGPRGNADDRYSTTQKNIGMPDLNSEHTDIQNKVYNMVVSLKDAGVDGIRWDAAKHIALPSENCGFWSKMAQIDMYQYGEILGSPADGATAAENTAWIDEYAEYIGVSDSVYSTALMSAVRDGTTYKSTGNWIKRGVDAGKIVNWAESHDSYANEPSHGGWTKTLDQSVIDKAYALLAARADSQTLYLSRPSQTAHQSIYYGQKGSTHFTSKEVAEVNRFHNAMIGKDEKVLGASTYYAVLRSGGAVIVTKSSDIDVTVNNNGSMVPVGTYTDKISGNSFTVTDKTITGHVGSSGIAVFYQTDQPVHVHIPAPAVRENEVPASCTAQGSYDEVIYCTSCGEEISRTPKTVSALGHTNGTPKKENEVPASCTAQGSYDEVIYCTSCGEEISRTPKTVSALGHTNGTPKKENEVPASCTAQGSYDEVIYCTSCGEEISRTPKTVSALGHSLQYVEEIPATPIADGTRAHYVCTRCGKLFADANGAAELSRQDLVLKAEYILGDADGDGSVTILDATFIQRALVGIVLPSPCDEKAADVDGDGDMTIMDVTYIQRVLVGIDVPYAIGDTLQLRDYSKTDWE